MKYPTTSKTLIEKLQTGDAVSWEEFYAKYSSIIIALGKCKNLSDSECDDLLQDVMLRFFQNSKTFVFDPKLAKFRTYFGRIVSGKIIDLQRKRSIAVDMPDHWEEAEDSPGPSDLLDACLLEQWRTFLFNEALEQLKNRADLKTYQAFELYGIQNREPQKVATLLSIKTEQVYLAKSRCLKILKSIIDEFNQEDPSLKVKSL